MRGTTIVIGGFLFQHTPAKIWGWGGKVNNCEYCSLPKFVKACRTCKREKPCCFAKALNCQLSRNKNLIWRKVKMPMPKDLIKRLESEVKNV